MGEQEPSARDGIGRQLQVGGIERWLGLLPARQHEVGVLEAPAHVAGDLSQRDRIERLGIGSDLCQDQPDSVVEWMRVGRWSKDIDYGEGSASQAGFPPQPSWFNDNRDLPGLADVLRGVGFGADDVARIMGDNWLAFFERSFGPMGAAA